MENEKEPLSIRIAHWLDEHMTRNFVAMAVLGAVLVALAPANVIAGFVWAGMGVAGLLMAMCLYIEFRYPDEYLDDDDMEGGSGDGI